MTAEEVATWLADTGLLLAAGAVLSVAVVVVGIVASALALSVAVRR